MKKTSKELVRIFDWAAPYVEKATPKSNPKKPKRHIAKKSARIAYHTAPREVPRRFIEGFPSNFPKDVRTKLIITRIEQFLLDHFKDIADYMASEYDVLMIHQDGDPTSKGYRLAHPNEKDAVLMQNEWGKKHDKGVVDSNDFPAEQSQRLFPRVDVERLRLVKR